MGRAGLELELESWIPSLEVCRVGFVEQARVLHPSGECGDQKLTGIGTFFVGRGQTAVFMARVYLLQFNWANGFSTVLSKLQTRY